MKKAIISLSLCMGLLGLAGCSKDEAPASKSKSEDTIKVSETYFSSKKNKATSEKASTSKTTESSSEETSESSTDSNISTTLWDANKSSELQSFMQSWGNTMGQSYNEYRPGNNVNFYGMPLPEAVLGNTESPLAVNDTIVSAEWSDTGESAAQYSIVAVYSDAETVSGMKTRHVYFFAFTNNQPVVLVSMQNQGMPDKALHTTQTENQALNSGFQAIAAGKSTEQPAAAAQPEPVNNDWTSMEEAIEFYEATYKNPANKVSKDIAWENYDRKCWSVTEQEGNRIVLHWSNISGAGGSYVKFIKYGDRTEITHYDGNMSYPDSPSKRFHVRNSDHQVI